MTIKPLIFKRLPMMFTASLLSTGLLLSGCSNNDSTETEAATENAETAVVAETPGEDTASQAEGAETTAESTQIKSEQIDNSADKTVIDSDNINSDNINPVTSSTKQKSLVTNPTQAGTPEDTVKQALDSLYYGDVKKAAQYYKVDMANFEEELAKTQSAFQQTVDGVTLFDTEYNNDKTRATITGELRLTGQSEPTSLTYELQKIDGQWKILG